MAVVVVVVNVLVVEEVMVLVMVLFDIKKGGERGGEQGEKEKNTGGIIIFSWMRFFANQASDSPITWFAEV